MKPSPPTIRIKASTMNMTDRPRGNVSRRRNAICGGGQTGGAVIFGTVGSVGETIDGGFGTVGFVGETGGGIFGTVGSVGETCSRNGNSFSSDIIGSFSPSSDFLPLLYHAWQAQNDAYSFHICRLL